MVNREVGTDEVRSEDRPAATEQKANTGSCVDGQTYRDPCTWMFVLGRSACLLQR